MIVWFCIALLLYLFVLLAEKALLTVTPHELEALRSLSGASSQRAANLGRQVRPTLAALLFARLLTSIAAVVFISGWLIRTFFLTGRTGAWAVQTGLPEWLASPLALALIALVFALLVRIAWAMPMPSNHASAWLRRLSGFIAFWKFIFNPLIPAESNQIIEFHEPQAPVADNTPPLTGEKRELELLRSIVKFSDTTVKQVMQPRSKIVAVDFRTDFSDLLETVRESGFSRMPVYDDDLDNVTGILYVKDLLPYLEESPEFEWQSIIRANLMLVPESKRAIELLEEFKQEKMHLAIVIDEYGGTSGIVTMEDILEEVTGEIRDEFDEESEVPFRKIDEFNYLFEGSTLLNDVCRLAGITPGTFDDARGDADTVAGLLLELSGDIPGVGNEFIWQNYRFTVTAADSRRIEQVKLTLPNISL